MTERTFGLISWYHLKSPGSDGVNGQMRSSCGKQAQAPTYQVSDYHNKSRVSQDHEEELSEPEALVPEHFDLAVSLRRSLGRRSKTERIYTHLFVERCQVIIDLSSQPQREA